MKAKRLWFMFDNHTFAEVDQSRPLAHSLELFYRDPCGSLFARDANDKTLPYDVHGRGGDDPNLEERVVAMLREVVDGQS